MSVGVDTLTPCVQVLLLAVVNDGHVRVHAAIEYLSIYAVYFEPLVWRRSQPGVILREDPLILVPFLRYRTVLDLSWKMSLYVNCRCIERRSQPLLEPQFDYISMLLFQKHNPCTLPSPPYIQISILQKTLKMISLNCDNQINITATRLLFFIGRREIFLILKEFSDCPISNILELKQKFHRMFTQLKQKQ